MKAFLSIAVFCGAYALIATEKINKTIVAVAGASLVLFLRLVTFEQAAAAIDMNVIFLLVGMMTCVYILSRTGFFEWVAISVARRAQGDPVRIMLWLLTVTAALSAVLDNVTTIIMIAPVTILIMQLLEISPVPLLILEALASNIGGTSTLIGDPPNIIIGSSAGLSFNDFLVHLFPVVALVFLVFLATNVLVFRRRFIASASVRSRVADAVPSLAVVDRANMKRSLIVLGFIFAGFFFHELAGVPPGIVALCGSMVMLVVCRHKSDDTLMRVEWGVIFFFIGMFMMIAALEANGVIAALGNGIIRVAGGDLFVMCLVVLWGSALFSAILDNIPFVIAMVPIIKQFIAHFAAGMPITDGAAQAHAATPLWWALALGACLGGNGTLIGASANVVMSRISEKNNYPVTFSRFLRYGTPFLLQSLLISTAYLWFRYFR
ncbi:MAG: SLC13 family permease [Deltaproteobacteria bacterium]